MNTFDLFQQFSDGQFMENYIKSIPCSSLQKVINY